MFAVSNVGTVNLRWRRSSGRKMIIEVLSKASRSGTQEDVTQHQEFLGLGNCNSYPPTGRDKESRQVAQDINEYFLTVFGRAVGEIKQHCKKDRIEVIKTLGVTPDSFLASRPIRLTKGL